ncbi:hypothetical protein ACVW17_003230 [Bradyrhizobium sp. USDA 4473]
MSISVRFFIFSPEGVQRVSQRILADLYNERKRMPQFAGAKLKVANAIIELSQRRPVRFLKLDGYYLEFDRNGGIREAQLSKFVDAMETFDDFERWKRRRTGSSTVIDLKPKLARDKWERENLWEPTKEDIATIANDIFDEGGPRLKWATAVSA